MYIDTSNPPLIARKHEENTLFKPRKCLLPIFSPFTSPTQLLQNLKHRGRAEGCGKVTWEWFQLLVAEGALSDECL